MDNLTLVSIDNGYDYDDNQTQPVAICKDAESARKYIDSHPITGEIYKDNFGYAPSSGALNRAHYFTQEVLNYTNN